MSITQQFIEAIERKFNEFEAERAHEQLKSKDYAIRHEYKFSIESGQKYDRIVQQSRCFSVRINGLADTNTTEWDSGHVHAFVERATGRLAKSAGWKSPARWGADLASRYDLSDIEEFNQAVDVADPYGSYLYQ